MEVIAWPHRRDRDEPPIIAGHGRAGNGYLGEVSPDSAVHAGGGRQATPSTAFRRALSPGAAGIDRGTADLLLSLPVARASVYASTSVIWLLTGLALAAATWAGVALGTALVPFPEPVDLSRIGMAGANQAALLLAIGGTTALVSCLVNRRGLAVAIAVALLLASFLVNFLAAFLPLAETIEFLGLLHYYRPVDIVGAGRWPVRDLCLLGTVAVVTWTAGLLVFRRKDIPVA